ncbi:MAG: MICOS complex subunit MIC10 family protein [Pirellulaceae bacterium]
MPTPAPSKRHPAKRTRSLKCHPICLLFPELPKPELEDLAADIKEKGLFNSIVLYEGKILDGRNRYNACRIAGVEPRFVEWSGGSPLEWVVSENFVRRHLSSSQRAVLALDLLPLLEVVPVFAVMGIVAGARYGFFFNISNHLTGGQLLWGIIGGFGAAAVGTLVVSLVMVIIGTAAGFAAGWIVGSFLRFQRRGAAPWIGAGVGALIQAGWASPVTAMQAGALGGVLGALAGPAFLLTCMGLGYVVPRRIGPPRHPFDE